MNNPNPVKIVETVLRDGHQSLCATRMRTSDMLPMLEALDDCGFYALEAWGGATFDSCLRFLNEDPWERLRTIRKHVKKTKLQMLLRGQNILGYNHYADDVVTEFVKRSVDNGIDIIRIFDAFNDTRNLETAMKATKAAGAHAQGTLVYTISPYHKDSDYLKLAKELVEMGADSICIKDMSGLLAPYACASLVEALKKEISIPVNVHSHCTSGMASMTLLKGIEAGADIVDTALSPFAETTSHPCTESLVYTLKGTERDTGIDMDKLGPIADHFKKVRADLVKTFKLPSNISINPKVLSFQIPGGMLSNMLNQLTEMGMADKYEEVLKEVPRVRADLGYPPLVTPSSQIVGTMATMNGAKAILEENNLGSLTPGKKADLIVIDPRSAGMLPLHDPIANLVSAMHSENIRDTMCNGKWLMRDRRLLTIDEDALYTEAQQRADAIRRRAGIALPSRFPLQ